VCVLGAARARCRRCARRHTCLATAACSRCVSMRWLDRWSGTWSWGDRGSDVDRLVLAARRVLTYIQLSAAHCACYVQDGRMYASRGRNRASEAVCMWWMLRCCRWWWTDGERPAGHAQRTSVRYALLMLGVEFARFELEWSATVSLSTGLNFRTDERAVLRRLGESSWPCRSVRSASVTTLASFVLGGGSAARLGSGARRRIVGT
jgi:hypothetical protein